MPTSVELLAQIEFSLAQRLYRLAYRPGLKLTRKLIARMLSHSAKAGHREAQVTYGRRLLEHGLTTQDRYCGARYLIQAAQQGDRDAQWWAGRIHERGVGPYPSNEAQAVTWYARAARQGHVDAIERLIQAYDEGELNLPQSERCALEWRERLATASQ